MIYLDTSAAIKLVIEEPESGQLARWITGQPGVPVVTSDLTRIELIRAILRTSPQAVPRGMNLLASFDVLRIDDHVITVAQSLADPRLRTLDAIHLASALRIRTDLTAVVAYDKRLAAAARAHDLPVQSPGAAEPARS